MKIDTVGAKSILTKSSIPGIDFVVNPYVGCQHACLYCYAEFMKRFTGHGGDTWGEFLDIKAIPFEKIRPERYDGKTILLSSVTDPYTPLEAKVRNTRRVLERLVGTKARLQILTKSGLLARDLDLFRQFDDILVGVSLCSLDLAFSRRVEPRASSPTARLEALRKVAEHGVPTYVFVSPIFPGITDWKRIVESTRTFAGAYHFENLNFRGHNVPRIEALIHEQRPDLTQLYRTLRRDRSIWPRMEREIRDYCDARDLSCRIEFHHGAPSKKI